MKKTIGMFAHVDAGKTTLAEQLLYHTRSIRQRGRVDHGNAFLDSHRIEKEKGITIFAEQAAMTYKGSTYYLVDTPGHLDFSPEMERTLPIMDYAVLILSAVEGVEAHTETIWELLRKYGVPTFFFINKTDRTGADAERVAGEIRTRLTGDVHEITNMPERRKIDENLATFLAERDDELLELYMEGHFDPERWIPGMRRLVQAGRWFPCASGSALRDDGITEFLDLLDLLTATDYSDKGPFAGRVYKIRHDEHGTRMTFVKATSGTLNVRDEIRYVTGSGPIREKITRINVYSGSKEQPVDQVTAGQLFAVTGLSAASAGDGLGALEDRMTGEMTPAIKSRVIFDPSLPVRDVLGCLRILDAEEPSLNVSWDESLQEIHVHVMGTTQQEVLKQWIRDRFGLEIEWGPPEIVYKETIVAPVSGYGHFEPLGHYAEVHLKLEPAERNSGVTLARDCHPDTLAVHYQNLVQQHLGEREHPGLLTGSPVTDVRITLTGGRAHPKHTSGGDFREAAFRALRQGLEKAENLLLEPYYHVKIRVDIDRMGKVLSDIRQAHGRFESPQMSGDIAVITGTVPVSTFLNYSTEFASFTKGRGAIRLKFGGYDRCHNEKEVIAKQNYHKDADPAYTSSSIFCSKGQSWTVPWHEAEQHMHGLRK